MQDYESLVQKLVESSGSDREAIEKKIREKQTELSGLISPEGAAHIIAREMGLQLVSKPTIKKLEIKNILPGMRNVTFNGRVVSVSDVREFTKKDGSKGRVRNITLADSSGSIRISLWNDEIDKFNFEVSSVFSLKGGYVVEDNRGLPEARIGKGSVSKIEDSDIPRIEELQKVSQRASAASIENLYEGAGGNLRAALLQLFESDPFYATCPQCNTSLNDEGKCKEHGEVTPNFAIVLSGIIDDGTGNIRAVFFRDVAEKLLGTNTKDALALADRLRDKSAPVKRAAASALGKEFTFVGRARRNKLFNRLEFIVNDFAEVNPSEEAKKIVQGFRGL